MSYNEAETRFYLIDPVLREKGYDAHWKLKLETPAPVEPTGYKGRRRIGAGRTDYLLCVKVGAGVTALEDCRQSLGTAEKAVREAQVKADAIDAAVIDLKAVNPRVRVERDTRSPKEIVASIAVQGKKVEAALARLSGLLEPA
jgi:predicted type IV restriction endonuclease